MFLVCSLWRERSNEWQGSSLRTLRMGMTQANAPPSPSHEPFATPLSVHPHRHNHPYGLTTPSCYSNQKFVFYMNHIITLYIHLFQSINTCNRFHNNVMYTVFSNTIVVFLVRSFSAAVVYIILNTQRVYNYNNL